MMSCECCGREHPFDELELTFRRPDDIFSLSDEERARDVREGDDTCRMRDGRCFVRGVLPLPVAGRDVPYNIGLWVEVDQAVYDRVVERWDDPDQANEPPLPARIANNVPTLPATLGLEAVLRLAGPTTRPNVFVALPGHPLHDEQTGGITAHRAFEHTALVRGGDETIQ